MALGGHPDADPDIRLALGVGQYVPSGADVPAVLLRYGKLRDAAAAGIVMMEQLGPIEQRQTHIKIFVDEVNDGGILTQACQPESCLRQWQTLL